MEINDISWYNVDLPEVIEARDKYFPPEKNETNISGDIIKLDFLDVVKKENNIFIFEAILPFFKEDEVIKVLKSLSKESKKAFFIIETCPEEIISMEFNYKYLKSPKSKIIYNWGCNNPDKFADKAGLVHIDSQKISDTLNERWDFSSYGEMLETFKNNFRIDLFQSK